MIQLLHSKWATWAFIFIGAGLVALGHSGELTGPAGNLLDTIGGFLMGLPVAIKSGKVERLLEAVRAADDGDFTKIQDALEALKGKKL